MLITMLREHVHKGERFPIYNNYDLSDEEAAELIACGAAADLNKMMVGESSEAEPEDDDDSDGDENKPKTRKRSKK